MSTHVYRREGVEKKVQNSVYVECERPLIVTRIFTGFDYLFYLKLHKCKIFQDCFTSRIARAWNLEDYFTSFLLFFVNYQQ